MANTQGIQHSTERPSTLREVAWPTDELLGPPPTDPIDYRVKIYEDQERTFTYLNTDLMNTQQRAIPPPMIYIIYSYGEGYRARQVATGVTENGTVYLL